MHPAPSTRSTCTSADWLLRRWNDWHQEPAGVMISGGGSVKVAASEDLDAAMSGVGQVPYLGSPRVLKAISGIGSVEPLHG